MPDTLERAIALLNSRAPGRNFTMTSFATYGSRWLGTCAAWLRTAMTWRTKATDNQTGEFLDILSIDSSQGRRPMLLGVFSRDSVAVAIHELLRRRFT